MEDNWGECNADKLEITLHEDCLKDDNLYMETLYHECLHAVIAMSGARYSCLSNNENKEEGIVRCIENLFLPLIKVINP